MSFDVPGPPLICREAVGDGTETIIQRFIVAINFAPDSGATMLSNFPWRGFCASAVMGAALWLGFFSFSLPVLGESSDIIAPGRVEGSAPIMSIGVAATGTVSEISVQMGSPVLSGQLLGKLDCLTTETDIRAREARLAAAQAIFDRVRNGSRPDEIAVGEAVVGNSAARADEAKKTLDRTSALQEGVSVSSARVLEVERDARIAAAQLQEARARLSLLKAGSREEDIRQAKALRDAAVADLDSARARLDQCSVRAPADGTVVDVLATPGQFFSSALPQPLLRIAPGGPVRIRAEVETRDAARICVAQNAMVAADASPNITIRAQVAAVSPAVVPRSISGTSTDSRVKEVLPVILNMASGGPPLAIGSAVTVRFEACISKS